MSHGRDFGSVHGSFGTLWQKRTACTTALVFLALVSSVLYLFSGRNFEVVSNDAQIHFCVCAETFHPDVRAAIFQAELEFLLVHSGGGFQCSFDSFAELGLINTSLCDILSGFALPVHTLCFSITKGNDHAERFACRNQFFDFLLVERQCCPAGIQTELLSKQYDLFAEVAAQVIEII